MYDKLLFVVISVFILLFPPLVKLIIANQNNEKITITIKGHTLLVEIADTLVKKATGLMYREQLEWDSGMLFVFDEPQQVRFWMKGTKIPLSIAFIDKNNVITEIVDLKPYDLTCKTSKAKVIYALEVNKGWFVSKSIKAGDKVIINR